MSGLKKPENAFLKLVRKLAPLSEKVAPNEPGNSTAGLTAVNDTEFAKIFLLDCGYANLRRVDDGLIMATVFAPYILGLSFYPGSEIFYSIELGPHSSLRQLPRVHALNAVKKYDLQREWTKIAAYKMAFLYARDRNILHHRPHKIVCRMLTRLMSLPHTLENISLR